MQGGDRKEIRAGLKSTRARLYEFFSVFFRGPRSAGLLALWPGVEESVAALCAALGSEPPELSGTLPPEPGEELEREFARLFYGVGRCTVALSESVYTSREAILCQGALREVSRIYDEAGVRPAGDPREADTLPFELAFSARLVEAERPELERTFITEHAAPLGLSVCAEIEKAPPEPRTRRAARLLRAFLKAERALLA